jgi:hypothetical protein
MEIEYEGPGTDMQQRSENYEANLPVCCKLASDIIAEREAIP